MMPIRTPRRSRDDEALATGRIRPFARARVAAFTATTGAACALLALAVGACDDGDPETTTLLDAAPPPPPGPCVVRRSPVKLCEAGAPPSEPDAGADAAPDADPDASVPEGGAPDAEAPDGGGPTGELPPPESENRCLVTEDLTLDCPSNLTAIDVGEEQGGGTDIVLSQLGLGRYASPTNASLVADNNAHLQHVRIAANGESSVTLDPLPTYVAGGEEIAGAYSVLGASPANGRPAHLFYFAKQPDGSLAFQSGPLGAGPVALGAPTSVPGSAIFRPRPIGAAGGEGFFVTQPRGGPPYHQPTGPLVLVRGLPDAPRVVQTNVVPETWIAAADPSSAPALLYHDGERLHLRGGDDFANELWSWEVERSTSGLASFDLGWLATPDGTKPVVLYRDRDAVLVRYADDEQEGVAGARVGESFSTCPRSSYLGVTCDECPVSQYCETGSDSISSAKLFSYDGRLFVAFMATDTRKKMGYNRSVIPVIGVGCTCTLEEREKTAIADSLVVVEVVPHDSAPAIVERMRIPLYKAGTAGHIVFSPRSDGAIDVVASPHFARYETATNKLPEKPVEVRFLRLSTSLIP